MARWMFTSRVICSVSHSTAREIRAADRHVFVAFVLLTLLVALAYSNGLPNEFANDDVVIIVMNKGLSRLRSIPSLWTSDYWASQRDPGELVAPTSTGLYRPLVMTSYALNAWATGLSPVSFRLANVLFHLLVTWQLYVLAIRLGWTAAAAAIAAGVFAVHPIHSEAVTGIVGRAELLMALGVLIGLWAWKQGRHGLSLGAFALGVFSKEQAVILPVLIWAASRWASSARPDVSRQKMTPGEGARLYGGYVLVFGLYLLARAHALGGLSPPPAGFLENPLATADWWTRLLTVAKVAGEYLGLCLWPSTLSADYSYNGIPLAQSALDPAVLWGLGSWGGLVILGLWPPRGDRRFTFAVALLAASFIPSSNLLVRIGTIMGERLFYLPSAGFCLLLGLGYEAAERAVRSGPVRWIGFGILTLLLGASTIRTAIRNQDWANPETLARAILRAVPGDVKAHLYVAKALKDQGKMQDALLHYETAVRLYPAFQQSYSYFNAGYGDTLLHVGRIEEGIQALERAARLEPTWSALHYNLGLAYARQGHLDKAETAWRSAVALNPSAPEIHSSLSRLYIERRRYAEALAEAQAALQRDPDFLLALGNRAWALEGLGRYEEAAEGYERVLARNPNFADLKERLAGLRARQATRDPRAR